MSSTILQHRGVIDCPTDFFRELLNEVVAAKLAGVPDDFEVIYVTSSPTIIFDLVGASKELLL
jgi:hypothetical protein